MTSKAIVTPLIGGEVGTPEASFVLAEYTDDGRTTSANFPIAPLHVHHADDEAWYILDGTMAFLLGEQTVQAGPGTAVFVPRGVPHSFWNARSEPARYLLVMSSRIARLVEALHARVDDVPALFAAHDSELLSSG